MLSFIRAYYHKVGKRSIVSERERHFITALSKLACDRKLRSPLCLVTRNHVNLPSCTACHIVVKILRITGGINNEGRALVLESTATTEIGHENVIWASSFRCDRRNSHASRSAKLSVVCLLQCQRRRRHKLRVHDISTVHGDGGWDRRIRSGPRRARYHSRRCARRFFRGSSMPRMRPPARCAPSNWKIRASIGAGRFPPPHGRCRWEPRRAQTRGEPSSYGLPCAPA